MTTLKYIAVALFIAAALAVAIYNSQDATRPCERVGWMPIAGNCN